MTNMWWKYATRIMEQNEETPTTSAMRVGVSLSNYSRWASGTKPKPEIAVKFARSYGENVLEALVAVELITEREAALTTKDMSKLEMLSHLTDVDLASEILNRASRNSGSTLNDPLEGDTFAEAENNLRHLRSVDFLSEDIDTLVKQNAADDPEIDIYGEQEGSMEEP